MRDNSLVQRLPCFRRLGRSRIHPNPPQNRPLLLKTQTNSPGGDSNRPRGHLKREREGCMAELYVSGTAQLHYVYPAVRLWALIMQRVSLLSAIETHSREPLTVRVREETACQHYKWRGWTPRFCLFLFSRVCDVTSGVCLRF